MNEKEIKQDEQPKVELKKFLIEIPVSLEQRIRDEARKEKRSRNAQINMVLEDRYEVEAV